MAWCWHGKVLAWQGAGMARCWHGKVLTLAKIKSSALELGHSFTRVDDSMACRGIPARARAPTPMHSPRDRFNRKRRCAPERPFGEPNAGGQGRRDAGQRQRRSGPPPPPPAESVHCYGPSIHRSMSEEPGARSEEHRHGKQEEGEEGAPRKAMACAMATYRASEQVELPFTRTVSQLCQLVLASKSA
ncbi:hypothetical protein JCM24511_09978 [Saitozyma sp. JCM 24511]|nr:hypothetical protein JCM24511_09978 [Saitozyma sp. JCM 24511]